MAFNWHRFFANFRNFRFNNTSEVLKYYLTRKKSFSCSHFINERSGRHVLASKIDSDDRGDRVHFWQATGFIVTAFCTVFSLKKIQAGTDDTNEVSRTPSTNTLLWQNRNASGKFERKNKKQTINFLKSNANGNAKRRLNFDENANEDLCPPSKRTTRSTQVSV